MSFGPETRRRLLVGVGRWPGCGCVLAVATSCGCSPDFVDRVDHGFGEPFAAFTDRHGWVESTARVVADWTRFVPMAIYTLVVAALLAFRGVPPAGALDGRRLARLRADHDAAEGGVRAGAARLRPHAAAATAASRPATRAARRWRPGSRSSWR